MTAPFNILNDLLRAFSSGGPGVVRLSAASAASGGTRIPEERLFQLVVPTWGVSTNQLVLPAPDPGKVVIIAGAATGGDLRTSSQTTVSINAGTLGASAKSAVAANQMVIAICESATNWKAFTIAQAGTLAALPPSA